MSLIRNNNRGKENNILFDTVPKTYREGNELRGILPVSIEQVPPVGSTNKKKESNTSLLPVE